MGRDVTKPTTTTLKQASDAKDAASDAASRLKSDLMQDAIGRMFAEDGEKTVPGTRELPVGTAPRYCSVRCSKQQPAAVWR
jgi:hypothetical protein